MKSLHCLLCAQAFFKSMLCGACDHGFCTECVVRIPWAARGRRGWYCCRCLARHEVPTRRVR